jgi:hypothetical protein
MPKLRDPLSASVAVLALCYVVGAPWAAADGLRSFGDALLNGSVVNAPLPIIAAQLVGLLALLRGHGRGATAGAVLLGLASSVSLAAAISDGDFSHDGLSAAHVAWQCLTVAATAGVLASLVARLALRRRAAVAA